MEIKRRNPSSLNIIVVFLLLFSLPFFIFTAYISTFEYPILILLGCSSLLFLYYYKSNQLSKKEIEFIEKNSVFIIEQKKYKEADYATPIIALSLACINNPIEYPHYFVFSLTISILLFVKYFMDRRKSKEFESKNQVLFLPTQIISLDSIHKVINISDINVLKLTNSSFYLNEKYGYLDIDIKELSSDKKEKLKLHLNKIASQTAAIPERINISF